VRVSREQRGVVQVARLLVRGQGSGAGRCSHPLAVFSASERRPWRQELRCWVGRRTRRGGQGRISRKPSTTFTAKTEWPIDWAHSASSLTGKQTATVLPPARSQKTRVLGTFPSTRSMFGEPGGSGLRALPPNPLPSLREEKLKMRQPPEPWYLTTPTSTQTSWPPVFPSAIRAGQDTGSILLRWRMGWRSECSLLATIRTALPRLSRHTPELPAPSHRWSRGPRSECRRRRRASPGRAPAAEHHSLCAEAP